MKTNMERYHESTDGVFKYLDCSTAHVTEEEMDALVECVTPTSSYHDDYGCWMYCIDTVYDDDVSAWREYPNLFGIVRYALARGCMYVRLDQDGWEHENLPTFEW